MLYDEINVCFNNSSINMLPVVSKVVEQWNTRTVSDLLDL